jgi:hypothetical protein
MNYSDKLKDPRWQKKRLEILNRDKWTCQICFDTEKTLHVHHRRYLRGREPWDIPNECLVTLCESCHEFETSEMQSQLDDLNCMIKDKFFSADVNKLTASFLHLQIPHSPDVFASVIHYWFSNAELTNEMLQRYFEHLNKKSESKF